MTAVMRTPRCCCWAAEPAVLVVCLVLLLLLACQLTAASSGSSDDCGCISSSSTDDLWPWTPGAASTSPTSSFPTSRVLAYYTSTPSNRLYLLGGRSASNASLYFNDVVRVDAQLQWIALPPSPFTPRVDASLFPCLTPTSPSPTDDCLIMLGGMDSGAAPLPDVWMTTTSGRVWSQLTTAYPFAWRSHRSVSFNGLTGSTLISGGVQGNTGALSAALDQFHSNRSWSRITAVAPFGQRMGHAMVWLSDGSALGLHVTMTGLVVGAGSSSEEVNDVWTSASDGRYWTRVTASAPFSVRFDVSDHLHRRGSAGGGRLPPRVHAPHRVAQ